MTILGIIYFIYLGCNYQVFKIKLNPKHKINDFYSNPTQDKIVTVYLSAKSSPFVKDKGTGLKL